MLENLPVVWKIIGAFFLGWLICAIPAAVFVWSMCKMAAIADERTRKILENEARSKFPTVQGRKTTYVK